jgi:hypothetical protein
MFFGVGTRLFRRPRGRCSSKSRLGSVRPLLEIFEDRLLPSTFTVIDLGDKGAGSGLEGDLRYAVNTANDNSDLSNRIVFDPALSGTITLTQGELVIAKAVEIAGPGMELLTVSGAHKSGVFDIAAAASQTVILSDLTIADGMGSGAWQGRVAGGGLFNESARVTLNHVAVVGNAVPAGGLGGGILNGRGMTVLNASIISDNHADEPGANDGAIANFGAMTLNDATVSENSTLALTNNIENNGNLTLSHALISGNTGSILNRNTILLEGCTIANNAANFGAGLENRGGHGNINHSLFLNNSARQAGGGIFLSGGQLAFSKDAVAGNAAVLGGGYFTDAGDLLLNNGTISGNGAEDQGGGIYYGGGYLSLNNDTITLNTATAGGGFFWDASTGIVRNTIVAGNRSADSGSDVLGTVISLGYNLVGQTDGSTGWRDSDLTGTAELPLDPRLGPLADYGGQTLTHALLADSPALGTGDPTQIGVSDQRGSIRQHPDRGAFEAAPAVRFHLVAPARVLRGEAFGVTVTAVDQWGNQASTYTGMVHFSSTDLRAQLPDDSAFAPEDLGAHTFSITLRTTGRQSIAAADTDDSRIVGSAAVDVVDNLAPSAASWPLWALLSLDTDSTGAHRRGGV